VVPPGDPPARPGSPSGVPAQGGLTDFGRATRGTGLHRRAARGPDFDCRTSRGSDVLSRALRGPRGPPPREWSASSTVYTRCTAPTATTAPEPAPAPTLAPLPLPQRPLGSEAAVLPVTPPVNPHRMVTRAKDGFQMATKPFTFTALPPSPIPSSVCAALTDPNWRAAMEDEYGPS
jgi:hypothetical protein